jgi:hypothetical protein
MGARKVGAEDPRVEFLKGKVFFSSPSSPNLLWGMAILLSNCRSFRGS